MTQTCLAKGAVLRARLPKRESHHRRRQALIPHARAAGENLALGGSNIVILYLEKAL